MKIWKNTNTLDGHDDGLNFTEDSSEAEIALLGSKPIKLENFNNLKGIFRAGVGKDNVPEKEAYERGIKVRFPSADTVNIIFNETATYTCSLIFKMFYGNVGTINPWVKNKRIEIKDKSLLVIGGGNIGGRVADYMTPFMNVSVFDILYNSLSDLPKLIKKADCITLHIPKTDRNETFMDNKKLSIMKKDAVLINTARGNIVDENALYEKIKSGKIKAAFDVFWNEPYFGKLTEFDKNQFFMSPHVASTCEGFLKGCRSGLDKLCLELEND